MFQVIAAIRSAARRKVPGVDGLTAEVFQAGGYGAAQVVREVSKMCLKLGVRPLEWSEGLVFPIYKGKGAQDDVGNMRPITVLPVIPVLSAFCKEVSGPK